MKDLPKPDSSQVISLKGKQDSNITRDRAISSNKCCQCQGAHSFGVCQFKTLCVHSVRKWGTLQGLVVLKGFCTKDAYKVHTLRVERTKEKSQSSHI